MQALLEYASYMPHGYCLFWQPWLVILYAGSDFLIFLSYSAIPIALLMFLRRRPDLRYRGLVALFAAFILLCGLTHLVSILTLWVPVYPLHGLVKLLTGIVSGITAVVLFTLIPRLVAIPSPRQLEEANARLRAEVAAHEETLEKLREAQRDLEDRVERRTAELSEANARLGIVTRETVHRGRNLLTIVSSLARQTARGATDIDAFLRTLMGRLEALSTATAAVIRDPSNTSAPLYKIVAEQLSPVLMTYGERVSIEGPPLDMATEAAQQLGLVIHELATNAQKFGALASDEGLVRISWSIDEPARPENLVFCWRESGVRSEKRPPVQASGGGFGTTLLLQAVPAMLSGSARRAATPDGLLYELTIPLSTVTPKVHVSDESTGPADIAFESRGGPAVA